MDSALKNRLETLLRQAQLSMGMACQASPSSAFQDVFNNICRLVFDEPSYCDLWDEPLLTHLSWFFQVKPPAATVFADQGAELHQRAQHVRRVNDVFFLTLTCDATIEEVWESLSTLAPA